MKLHSSRTQHKRGSAILVVMALLVVLTMIALANIDTLRHLQQELRHIDQEQQQKYEPGPGH